MYQELFFIFLLFRKPIKLKMKKQITLLSFFIIIKFNCSQEYYDLNGNFKMCIVNSNINILDVKSNCFGENMPNANNLDIENMEGIEQAYVFSKHNFLLETKGHECKIIARKYKFSRDLLFNRFIQNDVEIVRVSKHDCLKMLNEKKCGDFRQSFSMECSNNNTCWFRQPIVEEFPFYFGTIEKQFYECYINEKIVMAQNLNQNIFHHSIKPCYASDGICILPQTTIIWNVNDIRKCQYERLIHLTDLKRLQVSNSILFKSFQEKYLFKLKKKINDCETDFYSTTEGLYLSFYHGDLILKKKLEQFQISKYNLNHFIDSDKDDLLLAEQDYENYLIISMIKQMQCNVFINSINQNLHLQDTFVKLKNFGKR